MVLTNRPLISGVNRHEGLLPVTPDVQRESVGKRRSAEGGKLHEGTLLAGTRNELRMWLKKSVAKHGLAPRALPRSDSDMVSLPVSLAKPDLNGTLKFSHPSRRRKGYC